MAACSHPARTPSGSSASGRAASSLASASTKQASDRWQPGSAQLAADIPAPPLAGCAQAARASGWVRNENAQPGDPGFDVPGDPEDSREVVGYADRRAASCGDTVRLALSGPAADVQVDAFRLGAYRLSIGRLVWHSATVHVEPQPTPPPHTGTHLQEASWPTSVSVPITAAWPPGFYLLVPRTGAGAAGPAIPLVVRDDADPTPVLFVASTLTWSAYNEWGGYSLYHGPGQTAAERFATRARVSAFRRPLVGAGYSQLVHMDLPVVRELEKIAATSGEDVGYTTDVDVDQRPSQLLRHAELVFGGHSEYWTRRAYDALAVARSQGVNLAFLGANNLWWHARLDSSPGSVEPDREIVQRVTTGDPTPASRRQDWTLLWSQWPEHRDGAAILGQSHAAIGVHGGYQLMGAPSWMLEGTGLRAGTPEHPGSVLPLAVGNEADGFNPAAANPATLTVVAAGVLRGAQGPRTVSASYSTDPHGAAVFAAGTTDWACGLFGPCADQEVPDRTATALRALTSNVILAFARPQAGTSHPSPPGVVPPPATLLAALDPQAVGTYGGSEAAEEGGAKSR